jgi:hypothetical protein
VDFGTLVTDESGLEQRSRSRLDRDRAAAGLDRHEHAEEGMWYAELFISVSQARRASSPLLAKLGADNRLAHPRVPIRPPDGEDSRRHGLMLLANGRLKGQWMPG